MISRIFSAKTFGRRTLVLHVSIDTELWYLSTKGGYKVTSIASVDIVTDSQLSVLRFILLGLLVEVGLVGP